MPRLTPPVLASIAVALAVPHAAAQEMWRDRTGVWRYVEPPGWYDAPVVRRAPPPVLRAAPDDPGAHLRGLVPSYDEPVPYGEPVPEMYDAVPDISAYGPPSARERLGRDGYFERGIDIDANAGLGPDEGLDEGFSSGWDPGWGARDREPGDPYGRGIDLDRPAAAPPDADLAAGLARYAAAKRVALAKSDAAARSAAIRKANAWLVSLSRGPVSSEAIGAVDAAFGLTTDLADATNLPGAGTAVERPDASPGADDRRIAEAIARYTVTEDPADLPGGARIAALDGFFGLAPGGITLSGR